MFWRGVRMVKCVCVCVCVCVCSFPGSLTSAFLAGRERAVRHDWETGQSAGGVLPGAPPEPFPEPPSGVPQEPSPEPPSPAPVDFGALSCGRLIRCLTVIEIP